MTCFEIVKEVLDGTFAQIDGSEEERIAAIERMIPAISDEYMQALHKAVEVDYSDPVTRFAYIYTYTACHACIVSDVLSTSRPSLELLNREDVSVCCIGGGPGSEYLGVMKCVRRSGLQCALRFHMIDRCNEWTEDWCDVDKRAASGYSVSTYYNQLDVTQPESWQGRKKYLEADLFTLVYVMSELFANKEEAAFFFNHMFSAMRAGSIVLFIDNAAYSFYTWFDELANKHGLEVRDAINPDFRMPSDEQSSALGIYQQRLSRSPKLTANVAYRVGVKN